MKTVREAVLDLLRAFGMTTVFGNPGSTELPLFFNFPADFRYVLGLQESVVVGMADGYAQATRGPAFINLHSAAGVGHAMGNIFTAYKNNTPLVITAGQQARALMPFEPYLFSDQAVELPKPYVKWSCEPARAEDVPLAIARAIRIAMTQPQGPVLVSVPVDDWDRQTQPVALRVVSTQTRPAPDVLAVMASMLDSSRRPAFVVGAAVDRDAACNAFLQLAQRHLARVWVAPMSARCGFPEKHSLFAGFLPPVRERIVECLSGHDVIFVVGAPAFTHHVQGAGPHIPEATALCQLVDDPAMAAWAPTGTAAIGGIRLGLLDLLALCNPPTRDAPQRRRPARRTLEAAGLTTALVMQVLDELRDPADVIVEEAPSARTIMQSLLPMHGSDSFYTMASGGLGWGMPAAVGVALARPNARVIAIIGDGSAMYSIQALWNASQLKLRIVFVILKNRQYAAVRQFAQSFGFQSGQTPVGTDLPGLDFVALAGGHGCAAIRVDRASGLRDALAEALETDGPVLIEIEVD